MSVSVVKHARRIVVKVGSSLVTGGGKGLDHAALSRWAEQIAALTEQGREVVLVSSGAIAEGMSRLGWIKRPKSVRKLQAAAAVGQMGMVQAYESIFRVHGLNAAQVLLTHEDMADRTRYLNARSSLRTLLELRAVPIINENDAIATDEIRLGDNDTLAALVTNLVEAHCLIILTDQPGLYTGDPRKDPDATLVLNAHAGDPDLDNMAGGAGSSVGTGGMLTKILAAKRAARSGAHTVICSGREENVLLRLADGEAIGTQLVSRQETLAARRQWLADHLQMRGGVVIDDGAVRALQEEGKSLLPVGVKGITGNFLRGDVVAIVDTAGNEIARGLTNYSSSEARRIAGVASTSIEAELGYMDEPELIHRDNLVMLE
ncbi:MAG: glutamate 5-kinase [Hydrogenophilales bacterium 17-61-9]|nr:MAG: glutamate 5-kinase [Hydrogenophilales bacterium 17-61-9]